MQADPGRRRSLLVLAALAVAVVVVLMTFRMRVVLAGGKAVFVLAILGVLVWLAVSRRERR